MAMRHVSLREAFQRVLVGSGGRELGGLSAWLRRPELDSLAMLGAGDVACDREMQMRTELPQEGQ
jgi:hypothetical protein